MRNQGVIFLKFLAAILITYSHMALLFPKYEYLVTGGIIGDGLFFFCSGYTLFLGRHDSFVNWFKRRIYRIYPTIISWALLSAVLFDWQWSVVDLITTPRYWFIPCIMVYYFIIWFIRQYFREHMKVVFAISCIIVLCASYYMLDFNTSLMYCNIPFMRIFCFLFMLLGAMQTDRQTDRQTNVRSLVYSFCL